MGRSVATAKSVYWLLLGAPAVRPPGGHDCRSRSRHPQDEIHPRRSGPDLQRIHDRAVEGAAPPRSMAPPPHVGRGLFRFQSRERLYGLWRVPVRRAVQFSERSRAGGSVRGGAMESSPEEPDRGEREGSMTKLLTRKEAAEYITARYFTCAPGTLATRASVKKPGGSLPYRKLGGRIVLYDPADLDAWAESFMSEKMTR